MDPRLLTLVRDYQSAVAEAVALLEAGGIPRPATVFHWVAADVGAGHLPSGVGYFKHGFGCEVSARDFTVDFDFRANGEIDGFTPSKLCEFAGRRLRLYGLSREEVGSLFRVALDAGEIIRVDYGICTLAQTLPTDN